MFESRHKIGATLLGGWFLGSLFAVSSVAALEAEKKTVRQQAAVYVFSFEHQPAIGALDLIRLISPLANVELQPEDNALVVRDTVDAIELMKPVLEDYDHPPEDVRLEIKVLRSGTGQPANLPLDGRQQPRRKESFERMQEVLSFDYEPLAKAALTSKEGDEVTYPLSKDYSVSFRVGTVLAGQRLKLEDFRILKHAPTNNKTRRLKPKELFASTINLSLDQQFTLVLAEDTPEQEALRLEISCRREGPARD